MCQNVPVQVKYTSKTQSVIIIATSSTFASHDDYLANYTILCTCATDLVNVSTDLIFIHCFELLYDLRWESVQELLLTGGSGGGGGGRKCLSYIHTSLGRGALIFILILFPTPLPIKSICEWNEEGADLKFNISSSTVTYISYYLHHPQMRF